MHSRRGLIVALLCSAAWLSGCASVVPNGNPSFPVEVEQAQALLGQMHEHPRPLERPVVVLSGFLDPGWMTASVAETLRDTTAVSAQFIKVSFVGVRTFDDCADKVIAAVDQAVPSNDPRQTAEVDVVAMSMGGLVARFAASERTASQNGSTPRRLNIHRLFTISTPHCGAKMAKIFTIDQRVIDMRPGSDFLNHLNQCSAQYELCAYVRLNDGVVGEENAAPPGQVAWWVPNPPLHWSHIGAGDDPRILADISRRLRGEPPLSTSPASPPPH